MSYLLGFLALVSFFVGLTGAVNLSLPVAAVGFCITALFVWGVVAAEACRNRALS